MPIPRRIVVDPELPRCYHCISRCVRRAFLCGDEFEHRKDWIRDRLRRLAELFAMDVGGYAVMANHLHVILRTDPDRARSWSRLEVAQRWLGLFPPPQDLGPVATLARALARRRDRVEVLRRRLADLSWFMRCLKEPIARRANHEDDCTGRFWEGRFKCQVLLDEAAVLACSIYVDLNPIRAGLARTPEESDHTSVQERIRTRQRWLRRRPRSAQAKGRHKPAPRHAEDCWLAPIGLTTRGDGRRSLVGLALDDYLRLVDATGRMARAGKRGAVPAALRPILQRLEIDVDRWRSTMRGARRMFGTAIGHASSIAEEAARRGTRWVVSAIDLQQPLAAP